MKPRLPLRHLRDVFIDRHGATVVEYGLMLAFIALIMLVGLTQMGVSLQGVLQLMSDQLDAATR